MFLSIIIMLKWKFCGQGIKSYLENYLPPLHIDNSNRNKMLRLTFYQG